MDTNGLKRKVIQRKCQGNPKIGVLLQKAISAYEKSKITKDWLMKYFRELALLEK